MENFKIPNFAQTSWTELSWAFIIADARKRTSFYSVVCVRNWMMVLHHRSGDLISYIDYTADLLLWIHRPRNYDDVINGSIFRVTGPLCGEFTGQFPTQRPVLRSFNVVFQLVLNKRFSKQSWGWWFETPACSSWRHCNGSEITPWIHIRASD